MEPFVWTLWIITRTHAAVSHGLTEAPLLAILFFWEIRTTVSGIDL